MKSKGQKGVGRLGEKEGTKMGWYCHKYLKIFAGAHRNELRYKKYHVSHVYCG